MKYLVMTLALYSFHLSADDDSHLRCHLHLNGDVECNGLNYKYKPDNTVPKPEYNPFKSPWIKCDVLGNHEILCNKVYYVERKDVNQNTINKEPEYNPFSKPKKPNASKQ